MFNSESLKQKNILVWTLPPLKMFQLQLTKTCIVMEKQRPYYVPFLYLW